MSIKVLSCKSTSVAVTVLLAWFATAHIGHAVPQAPADKTEAKTDTAASADPEFEKYVDVERLRRAWHEQDAAQLAEVAVDFVVAERALKRPHKTISLDDMLETAVRIAAENKDSDTLERIEDIAKQRENQKLLTLIQLSSAARSVAASDWFASIDDLTPDAFHIYVAVRKSVMTAQVSGDSGQLDRAAELVKNATVLSDKQREDLQAKIASARESLPESDNPGAAAFQRLAGPSRDTTEQETWDAWERASDAEKQQIEKAGLDPDALRLAYAPPALRAPSRTPVFDPRQVVAGWTLMLYLAADCNLESAIMSNLEEALYIGSSPGVHVVVLADRHPADEEEDESYTSREIADAGEWSGARMYYVEKGQLTLIKDFGDVNSGSGRTLAEFLRLAVSRYPAQHYGLVFGGHGEAWVGVCPDESTDEEATTIPMEDLRRAIGQGVGRKLDLIGFDACLMANFEVLHTLAPLTRVVAGSEELSPGDGWNYVSLLRTLAKNPQASGLEVGQSIGEAFEDYFAKADRGSMHGATFSVVDMEKFQNVDKSLDYLARWIGSYLVRDLDGSWQKIARAAGDTTQYGGGDPREPPMGLIDLASFAQELGNQFTDPRMQKAIGSLTRSIQDATVFNTAGKDRSGSKGISIYLPHRRSSNLEESLEEYGHLPLAQRHSWYPFIQRATNLASLQEPEQMLSEVELAEGDESLDLMANLINGQSFDYAEFALAREIGGRTIVIGTSVIDPVNWWYIEPDDDGALSVTWDETWFTLRLGNQTLLCPTVYDASDPEEAEYYLKVSLELTRAGRDQWKDVTLEFYFGEDESVGVLDGAYVFKNGDERAINLRSGDRLRPRLLVVDADGEQSLVPSNRSIVTLTDPDELKLGMEPVKFPSYTVGFIAEDVNGNREHRFVEIKE